MRANAKNERIRRYYVVEHLTMREIGRLEGVTGAAICRRIKAMGIHRSAATQITSTCTSCKQSFIAARNRVRRFRNVYCSKACYIASRRNPHFKPSRHGLRRSRAVVAGVFALQPAHVVHHVDGNQKNANLLNLWVFASQADHIAYHHGSLATPIWRGDTDIAKLRPATPLGFEHYARENGYDVYVPNSQNT